MTLRTRALAALAPLALGLVALGLGAIGNSAQLGELSERILHDNYRSVLAAQRMKEAIERVDSAAAFRAAGRPDRAVLQEAPNLERFEIELRAQEANITEPGEAQATQELRARFAAYVAEGERYRALPPAALGEAYFGWMEPAFLRVKAAADRVLDLNQDAMVRKSNEARRVARRNVELMALATIVAILLGVFASATLTSRALQPLGALSRAVRLLAEGDLAARVPVRGEDEIAEVGREVNALAQRLSEYRKSSLGELLQAQQASQAAIDSLPDPVVVFASDAAVLNVNTAATAVLRIGEASGAPLAAVEPQVRALLERVRGHVLSGKGPYLPRGFEEAVPVASPEGDRWLLPRATPVHAEDGHVLGATILLQDVTRLRRFDELKNDLVATVAHEFRTPLTSLRMAIHLLIERLVGALNEKQAELLNAARDDCERLQGIVDDLLDLSRIQAGRVEIEPVPLSARAIVDAAVARRRDDARAAGVELVARVTTTVQQVVADPERIELVLGNLVSNALKHAPRGSAVEVQAAGEGGAVRFVVSDEGPGVPREYRERIFDKFFRVPGEKSEGVGLGLYIAREVVQAHGGEMGVENPEGRGARFWFTLPAA